MKVIVLLLALLALIPSTVGAASGSSAVSVDIVPGSFTATLTVDDGVAVLTVDDSTGTGRGWWVTVSCSCGMVQTGEIQTLAGDTTHRPHWQGATLVANSDEGLGTYRQLFAASRGRWIVTSGQGQRP